MESIVYGTAFLVDDEPNPNENIRVYKYNGLTFIGHDTTDIEYACNSDCSVNQLELSGYSQDVFGRYINVTSIRDEQKQCVIDTADVMDFDPGDDWYIRCAACDETLLDKREEHENA